MIYTSCYAKKDTHWGKRVGISLRRYAGVDAELDFFKPTPVMLKQWKASTQDNAAWNEYESEFWALMAKRRELIDEWLGKLNSFSDQTLLCVESTDEHCHRRLVGRIIKKYRPDVWGGEAVPRLQIGEKVQHTTVDKGIGEIIEFLGDYQEIACVVWDVEPLGGSSVVYHPIRNGWYTNQVHVPERYPTRMLKRVALQQQEQKTKRRRSKK